MDGVGIINVGLVSPVCLVILTLTVATRTSTGQRGRRCKRQRNTTCQDEQLVGELEFTSHDAILL